MTRAGELARSANPHPNPRVGAVMIATDGGLVGEGHHSAFRQPHAEANALSEAGERARGATLVVTLEPCNHHGNTPPCTEAIVAAGVSKVIVGAGDPDERVRGRGIERLRQSGIEVVVIDPPMEWLDPAYFHHRRTGRPLVILKLAATLDGQTSAADGTSQWITAEEARTDAHRLRAEADAIVIGAGTLRADDPRLDVRIEGYTGHQPRPVVIAGRRPLPPSARALHRNGLVLGTGESPVDLDGALMEMSEEGLLSILVEGGPTLAASFLAADLVDQGVLYLAGKLAGGVGRPLFDRPWPSLESARQVTIDRVTTLGPDLRIDFTPI
ncbi:MAG: bifunctional diaminohydroxyphosphoribosylaminopyrimidine deaminase/5-amino-6-(5-phosphoribosylamino)uracil reductase RibD [Actinomycetota bacterium]|nr:bifunctional diaminohydroxyphosphoribosylaminopyrimidine deaminase/5-amino-6-(5-phosphoribosylamino)uracil reductase RibD [Actinomycetota bacterium]